MRAGEPEVCCAHGTEGYAGNLPGTLSKYMVFLLLILENSFWT